MHRTALILQEDGVTFKAAEFEDIQVGDTFMLVEPDGTLVSDGLKWKCLETYFDQDPPGVKCDQVHDC